MQFSTFNQFCLYAESFVNLEKKNSNYDVRSYRLDRMRAILDFIGNPHLEYKTIHIAGSKGKGSTANFLAKAIEALGYKTAMYSSPHLVDYKERFTLAGKFFSEAELVFAANTLFSKLETFSFSDQWGTSLPTTFELLTAFAFLLFAQTNCQWAVIETGLGGRLDATNVIEAEAAVITPIELEHTAILGDTITLIATEKSKIIKNNKPVFLAYQVDEARDVFYKEAQINNSAVYDLKDNIKSISTKTTKAGQAVDIVWSDGQKDSLLLNMLGYVQAQNCALALMVLKHLDLYRNDVTIRALEAAKMVGRMEIISYEPTIIIDGAHTVKSLKYLIQSFVELYGDNTSTVIYGALEDKDHIHMSHYLLKHFKNIIVSTPGTFKKSDVDSLYSLLKVEANGYPNNPNVYLEKDPNCALRLALKLTTNDYAILCTGSFYMGGEIVTAFQNKDIEVACP